MVSDSARIEKNAGKHGVVPFEAVQVFANSIRTEKVTKFKSRQLVVVSGGLPNRRKCHMTETKSCPIKSKRLDLNVRAMKMAAYADPAAAHSQASWPHLLACIARADVSRRSVFRWQARGFVAGDGRLHALPCLAIFWI